MAVSYQAPKSYAADINADVKLVDINRDGVLDLVGIGYAGNASVLLGTGDGAFGAATVFPAGVLPSALSVTDVNGDGKPDILVADGGGGDGTMATDQGVSVLIGDGAGRFAAPVRYQFGDNTATLAVGDLNGDGRPDIVAGDSGPHGAFLHVLLNSGGGIFGTAVAYPFGGGDIGTLALADMNGDGKLDIVNADYVGVNILLGRGDGTFAAPTTYAAGDTPGTMAIADLNGDGRPDVVTVDQNGAINVLLNTGTGLSAPTALSTTAIGGLTAADIDGDGKVDLVLTVDSAVLVLLGNGNGTFGAPTQYAVPSGRAAVGRLNADGVADIALTSANVLLSATPACYCPGTRIQTPSGEVAIEALRIGDTVTTAGGAADPIRWIGRRAYAGRFFAGRAALRPILFRAGALGGGLPRRDLRVSPKHAMLLDGVLVEADLLVNGTTILRDDTCGSVEYIHLELSAHSIIFAEGAASETFVDDASRGTFHNAAEFGALYPDEPRRTARYCAPRVDRGDRLASIQHCLRTQAAA